jgi:hypothetical protein
MACNPPAINPPETAPAKTATGANSSFVLCLGMAATTAGGRDTKAELEPHNRLRQNMNW